MSLVLKKSKKVKKTISAPGNLQSQFIFKKNEIINDRYKLVREKGKGAFGITFEAIDIEDPKRVIIKLQLSSKSSVTTSFKNEINGLKKLSKKCNYIVCYLDSGKLNKVSYKQKDKKIIEDMYYIVMEDLEGMDLVDYINSPEHNPKDSLFVLSQLYEGLNNMHKLGIMHSDIKPENIIINPEKKTVKFIDFGLNCEADKDICDLSGTYLFISPEVKQIISDKTKDKLNAMDVVMSDWYALGLVMYLYHIKDFKYLDKMKPINIKQHKSILNKMKTEIMELTMSKTVREFILAALQYDPINRHMALLEFKKNKQYQELIQKKLNWITTK